MKAVTQIPSFEQCVDVWNALIDEGAHLDALLSKQPKEFKAWYSRFLNLVLVRPQTLCNDLKLTVKVHDQNQNLSLTISTLRKLYDHLASQILKDNVWQGFWKTPGGIQDFPKKMIQEWERDWGSESARELSQSLSGIAPLGMRLVRGVEREPLLSQVRGLHLSMDAPQGVSFVEYQSIQGDPVLAPLFREGKLEIQDLGSQIMAGFALWPTQFGPLLSFEGPRFSKNSPKPMVFQQNSTKEALRVVDACAGAGGKTLALADYLQGRGSVYAYDVSPVKLKALSNRAHKAGYRSIKSAVIHLDKMEEQVLGFKKKAHRVLVDAPCSGWGVLRRNPHMKWQNADESHDRLELLQKRVLKAYSQLVEQNGYLIYGVCTFRKSETLEQMAWFSQNHPEFIPVCGGFLGPSKGPLGTDGFFMYAWQRKSTSLSTSVPINDAGK